MEPFSIEWMQTVCDTDTEAKFEGTLVRLLNEYFEKPDKFQQLAGVFHRNCKTLRPHLNYEDAFDSFRQRSLKVSVQLINIMLGTLTKGRNEM